MSCASARQKNHCRAPYWKRTANNCSFPCVWRRDARQTPVAHLQFPRNHVQAAPLPWSHLSALQHTPGVDLHIRRPKITQDSYTNTSSHPRSHQTLPSPPPLQPPPLACRLALPLAAAPPAPPFLPPEAPPSLPPGRRPPLPTRTASGALLPGAHAGSGAPSSPGARARSGPSSLSARGDPALPPLPGGTRGIRPLLSWQRAQGSGAPSLSPRWPPEEEQRRRTTRTTTRTRKTRIRWPGPLFSFIGGARGRLLRRRYRTDSPKSSQMCVSL